ncbi:MAG: DNA-directed RNA polymerase subunit D [Thermoproteota archaeon]|nr:DNA-directed RNA polymerase subunit D [Candidatus Brockarchaeota archaeon]
MDVEVLKNEQNVLKFRWHNTNSSLANALRRVIISEVSTLAIEDVIFFENGSPMSDEQIAHILAMIPLTSPRGKYFPPDKCEEAEKERKKCRVVLTLEARAEKEPLWITSSMLISEDEEVKPVNPNIRITKLPPGRSIKLEAHAVLGKGKTHAKFQPGIAYYKFQPVIKIDYKQCTACSICVTSCPRGILKMENNKIVVVNPDECSLCALCSDKCPTRPKAIEASYLKDTVIFTIESNGNMSPIEIVDEAISVFKEKFNNVKLKVLGAEKVAK